MSRKYDVIYKTVMADCAFTLMRDEQVTKINPLPDDKFRTLPNWKSLQTTISNLTKMAESYPNG